MAILELKSEKRGIFGKKVKTLRNGGLIPAVVYGGKDGAIPLTLSLKEFLNIFKVAGETTLIKLSVGDKAKNVLINDVVRNPINEDVMHVDFYEVKMDEKINAKIPLIFTGDSLAVNDLGGVLVKAMQELEVRALPADLPHQIEIDISPLKAFSDNILVKDIKLPKGVEILENFETSVAAVVPPRSEAELESLKGEVEEKVEEVAVETEEKVKEREEKSKESEALEKGKPEAKS